MKAEVDAALKAGDTVGGVFEIVAHGVPVGLGSHAQWDEKLDGRLAQALMSVQAVKAVEIGSGITGGGIVRKRSAGRNFLRSNDQRRFQREQQSRWRIGRRHHEWRGCSDSRLS